MRLLPSRAIESKRKGESLSTQEMESFFHGYLAGDISDYQMAAFLMAVHFRGMSQAELDDLLRIMVHSGAVLDLSHLPGPKVDKHSTGGVGDKTSLVLAPLVASLGAYVPMMSGRGLGHTTGTLDKLEAIPGFRTELSLEEFLRVLEDTGLAMIGQTEEIAPLDRHLYALRDATATVPSIPLIAASIMSKKLAEGIGGLVLDVKTGAGSFLPDHGESLILARTMVGLGESKGVKTTALITGMDMPLGRAVGNGLETREALECLAGRGPPELEDLSLALAGEMLVAGGLAASPEAGYEVAKGALREGRGAERMTRVVEAQGGDPRVVEDPSRIPAAPHRGTVEARESGFVQGVDPLALGYGVVELGGGRRQVQDEVDPRVGFLLHVAPGDAVEVGQPLGEVHAADPDGLVRGRAVLGKAMALGPEAPAANPPLVRERLSGNSGG
jgi:pyrimidine-nucleoside phosphorylase